MKEQIKKLDVIWLINKWNVHIYPWNLLGGAEEERRVCEYKSFWFHRWKDKILELELEGWRLNQEIQFQFWLEGVAKIGRG